MSEKIQNSFYLLKDQINVFNKAKRKYEIQNVDAAYLEKLFRAKKFKEQSILPGINKAYEIRLFYKRTKNDIKWKDFIATIAQPSAEVLKFKETFSESYILLLLNLTTRKYYTTTGGYGHMVIQDIATTDLGIELLSRMVKAEDKALRSTKERSLTGGVEGSVKFFRNDYNFFENESFGSIYNELNASITRDKLIKYFGFSSSELKSDSLCIAKNSFSLKKSLSFIELLRVITSCEKLLTQPVLVEINTVVKINRSNSILIKSLNETLNRKIYVNYKDNNKFFSVEISHKDFEKYYQSSYSVLSFRVDRKDYTYEYEHPIRDIQATLEEIRHINRKLTATDFNRVITSASISTFDTDGAILTLDTLRGHYCTEITQGIRSYFLIEKDWYEISKTMIDKINATCSAFVNGKKYSGPLLHKWDKRFTSENNYNASYIGQKDSMVFDRITPFNIEVCDLLKWDKERIYLYHVKKGFDNSMRDLCNQVFIAARKVLEDSKNSYKFIESLYDVLSTNKGKTSYILNAKAQLNKISKVDFIKLFECRTPVFVLAVLDTSTKGVRQLESDIESFDSNIAKFSLNELTKNMRNLDVEFQILQLEK